MRTVCSDACFWFTSGDRSTIGSSVPPFFMTVVAGVVPVGFDAGAWHLWVAGCFLVFVFGGVAVLQSGFAFDPDCEFA